MVGGDELRNGQGLHYTSFRVSKFKFAMHWKGEMGRKKFFRHRTWKVGLGVPSLVSHEGAPSSLMIPGKTGAVFQLGNASDCARGLRECLSAWGCLQEMGHAAYVAFCESLCLPENNVQKLHSIYHEV